MIQIPLSQDKFALIDEGDAELISRYKWHAIRVNPRKSFYARTVLWSIGRRYWRIRMQNLILHAPDGFLVDHKDGDGLNNTRSNLRIATMAQNNAARPSAPGRSGYRGVIWDSGKRRWRARISENNHDITLGCFADPAEAAAVYDAAARKLHGEFAQVNFPLLVAPA